MLSLHNAGEAFDFYAVAPVNTYELSDDHKLPDEPPLTAAQFGNFIAGFGAGVTDELEVGTVKEFQGKYVSRAWVVTESRGAYDAVRLAGDFFDQDVPGWGDSPDSVEKIDRGYAAGRQWVQRLRAGKK